jgi:hypothetical protein
LSSSILDIVFPFHCWRVRAESSDETTAMDDAPRHCGEGTFAL